MNGLFLWVNYLVGKYTVNRPMDGMGWKVWKKRFGARNPANQLSLVVYPAI